MSSAAPPPPPPRPPDPLRSLLGKVSQLATRLQEWALFLTQLRSVANRIEALSKFVQDTAKGTPPTCTPEAWIGSQNMWEQIEQNDLEDLRAGVKAAQGITAASPLPRPGGDLAPVPVLDDIDSWLVDVRDAHQGGAAGKLREACGGVQRKLLRHIRSCFAQIQHESQSLTTLVHQIENELGPP